MIEIINDETGQLEFALSDGWLEEATEIARKLYDGNGKFFVQYFWFDGALGAWRPVPYVHPLWFYNGEDFQEGAVMPNGERVE